MAEDTPIPLVTVFTSMPWNKYVRQTGLDTFLPQAHLELSVPAVREARLRDYPAYWNTLAFSNMDDIEKESFKFWFRAHSMMAASISENVTAHDEEQLREQLAQIDRTTLETIIALNIDKGTSPGLAEAHEINQMLARQLRNNNIIHSTNNENLIQHYRDNVWVDKNR